MSKKQIKITCKGHTTMPIEALENFQGNLKTLDPEQEAKARQSIIKHGFAFPVLVWDSKIIDGTQRLFVVRKMLKEGYTIAEIPVCPIEAKDDKEAAEKLLVFNSRYGRITETGIMEFAKNFRLDLGALPEIHIPEIDFSALFENPAGLPDEGEKTNVDIIPEKFMIVIECGNEVEQVSIIEKLQSEGIECRALIS